MRGAGPASAGSVPAAVGAVAAPRPAAATGGRVLEAASRPRRRPRGGGHLRGAAGPGRRRAHPGRPAVDADPDPDHQGAAGRQPAPTPAATRSRVVGPGPSGQDPASGPSGLAGMAGSLHRTARPTDQPQPAGRRRPPAGHHRLVLRAMVPISLHHEQPGQARGNQPGWMMVPLPLGEPDPVRRLALIAAETAARTHKPAPRPAAGSSGSSLASALGIGTFRGSGR
jgi:hypothetical protein